MTSIQNNHISICICTYKRPHLLEKLLKKLQYQKTNDLFTYSIIVVDNDKNKSAKCIVEEFKQYDGIKGDTFAIKDEQE